MPLILANGKDRFVLPNQDVKTYDFQLKLPDGLVCNQCIIQVLSSDLWVSHLPHLKLFFYSLVDLLDRKQMGNRSKWQWMFRMWAPGNIQGLRRCWNPRGRWVRNIDNVGILVSLKFFQFYYRQPPKPTDAWPTSSITQNQQQTETTTSSEYPPSGGICKGVEPYGSDLDDWCDRNCNHVPSYCPESVCAC